MKASIVTTRTNRHFKLLTVFFLGLLFLILACSKDEDPNEPGPGTNSIISDAIKPTTISGDAIRNRFGSKIDPGNLIDYAGQPVPSYITKDNGTDNPVTNVGATLGRVLFYDQNLSIDNSISCASCHQQKLAFSDSAIVSTGVEGGLTERHSMRLVNARFGAEERFFWDERAETLEEQTTMPIRDHAEMGFSGENGRPDFEVLLTKLGEIDYYQELFTMTYGDPQITEKRIQKALAQFVRSIQSFDSKYDEGYTSSFSNFTDSEKRGLALFSADPTFNSSLVRTGGGVGCFNCHQAPEFSINPSSGNNGVITVANRPGAIDIDNTRAPTLRDLTNSSGKLNGPLMHDGSVRTFSQLMRTVGVIEVDDRNTRIDFLLASGGNLNITGQEANDIIAFINTLSGKNEYTDVKWSDPF